MNIILARLASPIGSRLFAGVVLVAALMPAQEIELGDLSDPISNSDHQMADELANTIASSEWLGVMAPVALSPFFGITCLAGMSQFGSELIGTNSFISTNPVLKDPLVFWIFLGLTILTSLPRLTKVSKPLAQGLDQLEAYSGIVTLLVMRFVASSATGDVPDPVALQMGVVSVTTDLLLSIAAVINILVINTVKFFFEILVWIIPFPFIDAMLEAGNKAACAGLMVIYAYSPLVATVLNLLMFVACLFAYFWIRRRVVYARTMMLDPVWATIQSSYGVPKKPELIVFPKTSFGEFSAKAKLRMEPCDEGWRFTNIVPLLNGKSIVVSKENTATIKPGMMTNQLFLSGPDACEFKFSRRFSNELAVVAHKLNAQLVSPSDEISVSAIELS